MSILYFCYVHRYRSNSTQELPREESGHSFSSALFLRDQIQHLIGAARTRAAVSVPTTRHAAGLARPHLADDPLDFRPRHSMSHAYVAKHVLDGIGGHSSSRSTPRAAAAIIDFRGGVDYVLLKSPWEFLRVAMPILQGRGR